MDTIKTNADRIRAMTDEEIAKWLATNEECADCWLLETCENDEYSNCYANFLNWLRSPAESEGEA